MPKETIYVVGAGGIGMPLAAFLANNGVPVTAVHTRTKSMDPQMTEVVVDLADRNPLSVRVHTVSLAKINGSHGGIIAVTAKATANRNIAPLLFRRIGDLPLVVLQNGIDVEAPFIEAGFQNVYRCVVYATGQRVDTFTYRFREVAPSPIGAIHGNGTDAVTIVDALSTPNFRLSANEH